MKRSTITKLSAGFILLVMVTLLVGRSVHIFSHCHNHSTEQSYNHHCELCDFKFSATKTEFTPLAWFAFLFSTILCLYLRGEIIEDVKPQNSRAPPAAAIF